MFALKLQCTVTHDINGDRAHISTPTELYENDTISSFPLGAHPQPRGRAVAKTHTNTSH